MYVPETVPTGNALAIAVQIEVPWVCYNAQFLYPRLSCRREPALKGLLGNWKSVGHPQVSQIIQPFMQRTAAKK